MLYSMAHETVFENRFMHILELNRMGCDIIVQEIMLYKWSMVQKYLQILELQRAYSAGYVPKVRQL